MTPVAHVGGHVESGTVHRDAPRDAAPDCCHLATFGPDTRIALFAEAPDAEGGQGADHDLFEMPHVDDDVWPGSEVEDRIRDELSGTVVGDVPTPGRAGARPDDHHPRLHE